MFDLNLTNNPKVTMRVFRAKFHKESGVTLIELMVASVILGIAITGVMSMIGTGRSIDIRNSLNRQARVAAAGIMEDTTYHYSNYAALPPLVLGDPPASTTLPSITLKSEVGTVSATTSIKVTLQNSAFNGINFDSKVIELMMNWPEGSPSDSIYLRKQITEVK